MIQKALFVKLNAKPGKEKAVEDFLMGGLPIVQNEPGTMTWYAIRMGPSEFAIFDTFQDDDGRQAHLAGDVAKALMTKGSELLSEPPSIGQVDVIAVKEQAEINAG